MGTELGANQLMNWANNNIMKRLKLINRGIYYAGRNPN